MSIKNAAELAQREANKLARAKYKEFKGVVTRSQRNFVTVGTALGLIAKDEMFKFDGYASFDAMLAAEFDMSTSTAYRLIDAARVVTILSQVGTIQSTIKNQSQALALVPLGKDRAAMVEVVEAATARGRLTAALIEEVRGELYPKTKVVDSTWREGGRLEIEPPPLDVKGALTQALDEAAAKTAEPMPREVYHCEKCGRGLADGIVKAAQRRCINCDVDRIHAAVEVGGPCVECAIQASSIGSGATQTAAEGNGFPPEADGDEGSFVGPMTSPAGSGDGSSLVAGSGLPKERIEEEAAGPCGRTDLPEDGEMHCGCGFEAAEHPAWLARFARIDEARRARLEDSPAAEPIPNPPVEPTPMAEPQQPGLDSPPVVGSEGFPRRAETDHHRVGGQGGEAPETPPVSVEPVELEDGDLAAVTSPSSSDPVVLVELFQAFTRAIDRVDIQAIAPMLLAADIEQLEVASAQIASFVGLIAHWHTP